MILIVVIIIIMGLVLVVDLVGYVIVLCAAPAAC